MQKPYVVTYKMPAFLIWYKLRSGAMHYKEFSSLYEAMLARLEEDKRNNDPDLEIVAIASESLDAIKVTHSRCFSMN